MLRDCPNGGYRFLPGISAFSSGTVAMPGHEIVHVTLASPLPWRDGFARIDRHLRGENRPRTALCGIELRSPQPFTFDGFAEFNEGYRGLLKRVEHPRGRGQSDSPHERGAGRRRAVRALALRLRLHRARHDARADLHRGRRGRDARPRAGPGGHRPPRGHVAGRDAREGALRDGGDAGSPARPRRRLGQRDGDRHLYGGIHPRLARRGDPASRRPRRHPRRPLVPEPPADRGLDFEMDLRGVARELVWS